MQRWKLLSLVAALSALTSACSGDKAPVSKAGPGPGPDTTQPKPLPKDPLKDPPKDPAASPDAGAGVAVEPTPTPSKWPAVDTDPQPGEGKDFVDEAKLFYRVVACGDDSPVPKPLDQKVVDAHCERLLPMMQGYKDHYLALAGPYIAEIRPKDLPPTVVYPFGGGDLLSALTTYPDAQEITTISLEYAGDPRRITKLSSKKTQFESLKLLRDSLSSLLRGDWNWSRNLKQTQQGDLPGQVANAMVALVLHGFQPVSLRYFRLRPDGTLDYLDTDEIKAVEGKHPKELRKSWLAPDWSEAFSNMEIRFQPKGGGPIRVFRHIAFNLDDDHLTKNPALLAHLEAKGQVAAMTRAASHLMWETYFSKIRDYLTGHLVWMLSDSTGVPPPFAEKAGLVQEPYGQFEEAYEPSDQGHRPQYNEAYVALFKKGPQRKLTFRYGYPDAKHHYHMIVTRRP